MTTTLIQTALNHAHYKARNYLKFLQESAFEQQVLLKGTLPFNEAKQAIRSARAHLRYIKQKHQEERAYLISIGNIRLEREKKRLLEQMSLCTAAIEHSGVQVDKDLLQQAKEMFREQVIQQLQDELITAPIEAKLRKQFEHDKKLIRSDARQHINELSRQLKQQDREMTILKAILQDRDKEIVQLINQRDASNSTKQELQTKSLELQNRLESVSGLVQDIQDRTNPNDYRTQELLDSVQHFLTGTE